MKKGYIVKHHSGRVYTILEIANAKAPSIKFPLTVVYQGANGEIWARDLEEFKQKFTVLFDGTNLA